MIIMCVAVVLISVIRILIFFDAVISKPIDGSRNGRSLARDPGGGGYQGADNSIEDLVSRSIHSALRSVPRHNASSSNRIPLLCRREEIESTVCETDLDPR